MPKSSKKILVISSDYFCYRMKMFNLLNIKIDTISESTFKKMGSFSKYLLLRKYDIIHFFFVKTSSTIVNIAKFAKVKIINHFIGTDVYNLMNSSPKTINKAISITSRVTKTLAISPHLIEELKNISINNVEYFPIFFQDTSHVGESEPFSKSVNKILSYIPESREKFYGMSFILKIAEKFPKVEILIAGHSGRNGNYPKNITFLGWTDNFLYYLKQCSIFIRNTIHDGLPNTVLEAMLFKKQVLYNHNMPHTLDATIENLEKLLHNYKPNDEGQKYVLENFNKELIENNLNDLYSTL